jgi:hypothetical protein
MENPNQYFIVEVRSSRNPEIWDVSPNWPKPIKGSELHNLVEGMKSNLLASALVNHRIVEMAPTKVYVCDPQFTPYTV